jgi:3-oxo-5-alpha-steroid 4-dehydrogenase
MLVSHRHADTRLVLLPQGWWLLREPAVNSGSLTDMRFLGGCIVWAVGWGINLHSDATLRGLRKPGQSSEQLHAAAVT